MPPSRKFCSLLFFFSPFFSFLFPFPFLPLSVFLFHLFFFSFSVCFLHRLYRLFRFFFASARSLVADSGSFVSVLHPPKRCLRTCKNLRIPFRVFVFLAFLLFISFIFSSSLPFWTSICFILPFVGSMVFPLFLLRLVQRMICNLIQTYADLAFLFSSEVQQYRTPNKKDRPSKPKK